MQHQEQLEKKLARSRSDHLNLILHRIAGWRWSRSFHSRGAYSLKLPCGVLRAKKALKGLTSCLGLRHHGLNGVQRQKQKLDLLSESFKSHLFEVKKLQEAQAKAPQSQVL